MKSGWKVYADELKEVTQTDLSDRAEFRSKKASGGAAGAAEGVSEQGVCASGCRHRFVCWVWASSYCLRQQPVSTRLVRCQRLMSDHFHALFPAGYVFFCLCTLGAGKDGQPASVPAAAGASASTSTATPTPSSSSSAAAPGTSSGSSSGTAGSAAASTDSGGKGKGKGKGTCACPTRFSVLAYGVSCPVFIVPDSCTMVPFAVSDCMYQLQALLFYGPVLCTHEMS